MARPRHNPNGLVDGTIVRNALRPSAVFRVRGDPGAGPATYVAMTKGQRTVLNGNARNYRPETDEEAANRVGDADPQIEAVEAPREPAERILRSVDAAPEPDSEITALCTRMTDVVTLVSDGTCTPQEAAAIVRAAAELNWTVAMKDLGSTEAPEP